MPPPIPESNSMRKDAPSPCPIRNPSERRERKRSSSSGRPRALRGRYRQRGPPKARCTLAPTPGRSVSVAGLANDETCTASGKRPGPLPSALRSPLAPRDRNTSPFRWVRPGGPARASRPDDPGSTSSHSSAPVLEGPRPEPSPLHSTGETPAWTRLSPRWAFDSRIVPNRREFEQAIQRARSSGERRGG